MLTNIANFRSSVSKTGSVANNRASFSGNTSNRETFYHETELIYGVACESSMTHILEVYKNISTKVVRLLNHCIDQISTTF